jgi:two-component system CheB/CheR fusion protein
VNAESQQRILVAELNHRVKNMLTVIVSIAAQTLKRSDSVETFGKAFLDRVNAMAQSYELVARDHWSNISLLAILKQALEPYRLEQSERVTFEGPEVSLSPKLALSLGMIFHELGTNAAKYGSLSVAGGKLEAAWSLEKRSRTSLVIDWVERNGPPPKRNHVRGFGLTLIEREVSHGLGGKVEVQFAEDGLRANLRIPLESE